jgi:SPOR domain
MKKIFSLIILCFSSHLVMLSQEVSNNDSLTSVIKDNRLDKLNETYTKSYKLKGYRVQIYSGNKRQPANQARSTFSRLYRKKKAHMDYEQPYYKVRVGDFRTKIEALNFKNDLIKHFPNCFIVNDEIDIEELITN